MQEKSHLLNRIIAAVLTISFILAWLSPHRSFAAADRSRETIRTHRIQKAETTTRQIARVQRQPATPQSFADESPSIPESYAEYVKHQKVDPMYDWKQPINFYGKVVDESNEPVIGASVDYMWSTVDAERGTLTKHGMTDQSGLFTIHERGSGIGITVSKDGYYTPKSERLRNFEYANHGNGVFTPEPNNPVVFHLRKMRAGVELITSQNGIHTDFPIHIPRNGTPIMVDLIQHKVGNTGQIRISEHKPDYNVWKEATAWDFKMEISDGGFLEENNQFPFEAPDVGYQSVLQFDFQKNEPDWADHINKKYYIRFGNPPRYGWLHIHTDITMGGAILTYAINPDGSRNLEPKANPAMEGVFDSEGILFPGSSGLPMR